MSNLIYQFNLDKPLIFFKAGEFRGEPGWLHDYTINNDNSYEIMIVVKGCIYVEINHIKYAVHENECVLVPPFTPHFGYQPTSTKTQHYWLHFYPQNEVKKVKVLPPKKQILSTDIFLPDLFKIDKLERLILPMQQLLDCYEGNDTQESFKDLLPANYFTSSIVIELGSQFYVQYRNYENINYKTSASRRVEMICHWIRLHADLPITVQNVADHFGITVPSLTHLMKSHRQITTIGYIHTCKMNLAKNFLITTDQPIKGIARKLGYENIKYFMRLFKEKTGVTPTQYRNSYTKCYVNNNYVNPNIYS